MILEHSREDGILDIQLQGRIDGQGATDLKQELESVIESDDKAVLLNMRQLEYINSGGMRSILALVKSLERRQTKFAAYSLIGPVKEVFQLSGFDRVITVRTTKTEAIATVEE